MIKMINVPKNVSREFLIELANTPICNADFLNSGISLEEIQMANLYALGVDFDILVDNIAHRFEGQEERFKDLAQLQINYGKYIIIETSISLLNAGVSKNTVATSLAISTEQINKIIELAKK